MATNFLAWFDQTLAANGGNEAVATLKPFVDERRAQLAQLDGIEDMRALVQQHAQDRNSPGLVAAFDRASAQYLAAANAAKDQSPPPTGWFATLLSYSGGIVVGLITFALLGIIGYFLLHETLLRSLADVAVARGLITFFFTIGTIGIGFVMIASLFVSSLEGSLLKQRFDSGKEILTALIAILGTVVGFYFGSQSSERADAVIELQPIVVSDAAPAAAETVQISTLAAGGEPPYRYTIDFQWPEADGELAAELPDITNKQSPTGFIAEKFAIPRPAAGKSIPYVILVTDASNRSASLSGETLEIAGPDEVSASSADGRRPPQ